jgi:tetratricopeptide (TPR) repeat protein
VLSRVQPWFIFLLAMASAALVVAASVHMADFPKSRMVSLDELVVNENIVQDIGAISLGARRVGANLAYIQLLQYYGVGLFHHPKDDEGDGHAQARYPRIKQVEIDLNFPRLQEFGFRIIRLHPRFNAAVLEVAGALAFNQHRTDEALELLREAITRDPVFFRYHLYTAAILYKFDNDDDKLIEKLDEAVQYPDCPPLLKNVLANLYKKKGQFENAAKIYINIIERGVHESDRNHAAYELKKIIMNHPHLRLLLDPAP